MKQKSIKHLFYLIMTLNLLSCMSMRTKDKETKEFFVKKQIGVGIHYIAYNNDSIRYIETGRKEDNTPIVVFVHGAPGSSDNYFEYLANDSLGAIARLIAVDRLGYGFSNYGSPETTMDGQAALIDTILSQYHTNKIILIGHSYGGPVIARYAMNHPNKVSALIMLAPAIDPAAEKIFWFSYFAKWKVSKYLMSPALRVAGDEKFSHAEELRKIENDWDKIAIPVVHMHGDKDGLVSYENLSFSEEKINPALLKSVTLKGAGHFIPWKNEHEVLEEIFLLLKEI